mgnify:CR=1 FL=1
MTKCQQLMLLSKSHMTRKNTKLQNKNSDVDEPFTCYQVQLFMLI